MNINSSSNNIIIHRIDMIIEGLNHIKQIMTELDIGEQNGVGKV